MFIVPRVPDGNDLLYTVKRSSTFQMKMQLDVFLVSNINGEICDFLVKGSFTNQSFKVYKGDTLIPEVKERFKLGSFFKGGENFEEFILAWIMRLLSQY
ncbi:putative transcription factor SCREAM2-like [Capsicum annuum]|uniref:Uncharacterized protein n=1 Tax=Capsicum annuum TaxID=4072 RepID=A0A2G2Z8W4_CAPAN|nr:putative transcription factor SCREAM2-like [Capsicum annuum]KAF3638753.1 putative transcription factor SCREAM2-like [Capsicum annuum]PHT78453.1 hypothetical protein T459_16505 [Capsicum annuum]